jgi:hypothetical protein
LLRICARLILNSEAAKIGPFLSGEDMLQLAARYLQFGAFVLCRLKRTFYVFVNLDGEKIRSHLKIKIMPENKARSNEKTEHTGCM